MTLRRAALQMTTLALHRRSPMKIRLLASLAIIAAMITFGAFRASAQVLPPTMRILPSNPTVSPLQTELFTALSIIPLTSGSVSAISAGAEHTCALLPNGTVQCWGMNYSGQLGDGTTNDSSTPVTVNGLTGATAVSAGAAHTCALLNNGTVECWGDNSWGQLGNGTKVSSKLPVAITGLSGVTQVVAGYEDTCALLVDSSVQCWGANANSDIPAPVPGISGDPILQYVLAIAGGVGQGGIGGGHMCALLDGGEVACWGDNSYGQLGNVGPGGATLMVQNLSGAIAIAAGNAHTCALLSDGTVECWGWNSWGELGDATTNNSTTPQMLNGLKEKVIGIAAGYGHTCALLDNGTASCWGLNDAGELGNGTTIATPPFGVLAPQTVSGLSGATAIVAGGDHTCVVLASGGAQCWGSNSNGQLGNGTTTLSSVPVGVWLDDMAAQGAVHLSSNELALYSCALMASGSAQCWGFNPFGQLGNGTTTSSTSPVALSELSGMKEISNSSNAPCALLPDGTVQCWGHNLYGALGDGTFTDSVTPVQVALNGVKAIASGYEFTCALRSGGTVACWGLNDQGQLGDGTFTNSGTPVAVSGLSGIKAIGVGYDHVCAIGSDSSVACWGGNADGQLGIGSVSTTGGTPTPTHLFGLSGMTEISAGTFSTCVRHIFGDIYCWGTNGNGQLGDGDFTDQSSPVLVAGATPAVAVASSAVHSCALAADGTVQCWGFGVDGELGNGAFNTSATPVAVSGLAGVKEIASGGGADCVLLYNGTVNCWGWGSYGQLGNGAGNNSDVPVATLPLVTPLVWSSDTPSIATIDPSSGLATAGSTQGSTIITATYADRSASTTLTVGVAYPVITWPANMAIIYGTPLSSTQLDASTDVPGMFAYDPPLGTLLPVGEQTLSATFTPTDTSYYATVNATGYVDVNPATPMVTVTGGSFPYDGAPHAAMAVATGINNAPVSGTFSFVYTPGNTATPVAAGTYGVTANFTTGDGNYNNGSGAGTLTIGKVGSATSITSNTPSASLTGQMVTIAFTVTGVTQPTGNVTVTASTGESCTGPLTSAGLGSCGITFVTTGTRTLTAVYGGDTNFNGSSSGTVSQSVSGPVCHLSTNSINFNSGAASGNIYPASIVTEPVTLTNSGNTAMTISGPILSIVKGGNSNEFVEVNLCPRSLAAGKSCNITVAFVAGPYYTQQTATLSIMDSAPGSPQTVALSALVINPQASLSATSLSFGTLTVNTSSTKTVTLKNTGTTPLLSIGLAITGATSDFTANTAGTTCGSSLNPGSSCNISVNFKPSSKGARSATLTITDNAKSGRQTVALSGSGK